MEPNLQKRITVIQGDITGLKMDAIVNAANSSLLGGGGVDGAIHRAAGPGLLAECRTLGGCPTGEARITRGYDLPVRHVIHTVGPVYRKQAEAESARLLANCYRNSLILAKKHRIKTIAFPAISCGVYGYPLQKACKIAIQTTGVYLQGCEMFQQIAFVLFSNQDYRVYLDYLDTMKGK